jgi:ferredoxin-NADP reductase
MRNACARTDAAFLALATGVGVMPATSTARAAFDSGTSVTAVVASAILRAHIPESPPPRA